MLQVIAKIASYKIFIFIVNVFAIFVNISFAFIQIEQKLTTMFETDIQLYKKHISISIQSLRHFYLIFSLKPLQWAVKFTTVKGFEFEESSRC